MPTHKLIPSGISVAESIILARSVPMSWTIIETEQSNLLYCRAALNQGFESEDEKPYVGLHVTHAHCTRPHLASMGLRSGATRNHRWRPFSGFHQIQTQDPNLLQGVNLISTVHIS